MNSIYTTFLSYTYIHTCIPMIKFNLWIRYSKRSTIITNNKIEHLQQCSAIKVAPVALGWLLSKARVTVNTPSPATHLSSRSDPRGSYEATCGQGAWTGQRPWTRGRLGSQAGWGGTARELTALPKSVCSLRLMPRFFLELSTAHGVLSDHTGPRVTENAGRRGGRRFYLFLIII